MTDAPIRFPARPIRVRPPGRGAMSDVWSLLLALFVSVGCALLVLFPVPALVSDLAVRDAARPLPGATIAHGSCSTHVFLVSCEATLTLARPGAPPLERTLHYFFVDLHSGDYSAQVVADPARPEQMTTDLALDKMGNRLATLAIAGPIFLLVAILALVMTVRSLRRHRATRRALSGQMLRAVALRLDGRGQRTWRVSRPPAGAREDWSVPRRARPIFLDASGRQILGVTAGDGRVAMPLDAKLSWIKLSKEERAELHERLGLA